MTPWTGAHQGPLSMGILQAKILEWVAMAPLQGVFPTQGLNPGLPHCRQIIYPLSPQGNPKKAQYSVSSVQSLSRVQHATPWTAAHQASLSITNSRSLLKLMSIESVMPSNHLILCHLLLLPPSIVPSIRVFSNESVLRIRWPKYSVLPVNIQD